MVDPVVEAGVADTLEARLADAQKRIENGEYGKIPLAIVEFGIRAQWATEHPSCPASPRPIRNDDGVDDEVDGGARVSGNDGTKQRGVIKFDGGIDRSQARVQRSTAAPGSSRADVGGRRRSPLRSGGGFLTTTHVTAGGIAPAESIEPQLEIAGLKGFADGTVPIPPKENVVVRAAAGGGSAGNEAQLKKSSCRKQLAGGGDGGGESKKRMTMVPGTCESLDVDSLTSYILQDEAMQEADKPTELLLQASDVAPMKQSHQQEQRGKLSGGGSGGGRSTKDVDEKKSTRSKGREAIVEFGIRAQWATEHPSCRVSPRPIRNDDGVDDEVDGGARVSGNDGTKQRGVIKFDGGIDRSQARVQRSTAAPGSSRADVGGRRRSPLRSGGGFPTTTHVTAGGIAPAESIEPQLEIAGLKGFADGTVPIPPKENVVLRRELSAAHLLTFMVILRFCLPVVQLVLRSCRERLDAGHQAWHFILSTYQVKDDLYIGQLEEKMTHIRMGEQESATDYCNRARRILAEMRMAGAEYSMATYITHVLKGLPHSYNLVKRMTMVPGTCESLDVDSLTSYILQDEAMQEADKPTELLLQASDVAPMKQSHQQEQRGKLSGGGSGGGRSTKDVDEKKSTRSKGREGGGRRRECWICYDPDLLSYEWAMLTPVRWR
ncbi:unnamed protein product [Closterium sp. NIES-53]